MKTALLTFLIVLSFALGAVAQTTVVGAGGGSITVQQNGSTLTNAASTINYTTGMSCSAVGSVVTCTSTGGATSFYQTFQNAAVDLMQRNKVNFLNGITCADNAGSTRTDCSPTYGTTANTVAQGNDSRIANAVQNTLTINGKALSGNITLGLASADFANQGTTTGVLHGNAAGNPSFGQVVNADIAAATIDVTSKITGIVPGLNGGTGNGFTAFTGPTTSLKTFTLPNANATILTDNTDVTVAQGGTGVSTISGLIKGNGASPFSAAAAADVTTLWSNSCDATKALFGDGSCQVTIKGSTASGRVPFSSGTNTLTDSANLQYSASAGFTQTLGANNVDGYYAKRFTDTTPTGNFIRFQNNAATQDLFKIGVDGSVTATSYNSSNPSGNAGLVALVQGTLPSDVSNAVNFIAPSSVTAYHLLMPSAIAAGFWRHDGSGNVTFGELTSDVSSSGLNVTVNKVHGVTYPTTGASFPALPFLTSSNVVQYVQVNGGSDCGDATHALKFTAASATIGCQTITAAAPGAGGAPTQVQVNVANALTGFAAFTTNSIDTVTIGLAGTTTGKLALGGATSGSVTHTAAAAAGGTVIWQNKTGDGGVTSGTLPNGNLASFDSSSRIIDSNVVASNVVTQTSNASANQICAYTGANKVCIPTTTLPTAAVPAFSGGDVTNSAGSLSLALASKYKTWSCQTGLGDGLNAIPAGTYLQSFCYNDTGATITLTGLRCNTDNSGSSTMNAAGNTLGALLTGAVTCTSSFAAGTQSANVALTAGDYIKFTFVADGTSKQTTWEVQGTY